MPDKDEDINLRSEEVQEILSKVPGWMIRWGNVLFLFLILALLTISWFIKYPDIISAQAIISTQVPPQREYSKVNGKIEKFLVEDNSKVSKNEPIVIIENTAKYEDVILLKSIVDTTYVNSDNFKFPLDSLPFLFLGEIDADYALFQNTYTQYILNEDLNPFSNEILANELSIRELKLQLSNMEIQREINASELGYKKNNRDRNQVLFEKGVISNMEFEKEKLEYLQAERNHASMNASISQLREAISNANRNYRESRINKTMESISLLKNVLQSFNQLQLSIKNWELKYVLKADMEGKVSFQSLRTQNETVSQGDLVFTVIPTDKNKYIAFLKTPIQNSGKIKIGQKVNIKLDNYPDIEFGVLEGTLKSMSLIPTSDGFYSIRVSLPPELFTSYGKLIEYQPEMSGTAEIITENLSLFDRLFYQFKKIL